MRSCIYAARIRPACGSRRAFLRGPNLTRDAQRLSMAQEDSPRSPHGCSNRLKLVRFSKYREARVCSSEDNPSRCA